MNGFDFSASWRRVRLQPLEVFDELNRNIFKSVTGSESSESKDLTVMVPESVKEISQKLLFKRVLRTYSYMKNIIPII